jgi:hypothetical protein
MGAMAGRVLAWVGGVVALAATVGLCVLFAVVGLDKANELAGVVSALLALAGLVVSVCGLVAASRAAGPAAVMPAPGNMPPAAPAITEPSGMRGGGQSVTGPVFGGVTQIKDVGGDVSLGGP